MPNSVLSTLAILRINKSYNVQCQKIWYSEIFELSKSMVIEHKNEATLAEVLFYAKKKEIQF